MKLRVLGCDGGRGLGYNTTSLLFNDTVLIDAGTIQSAMRIEEALKITNIFLTHSHLDHIIDLPFLLDATFMKRAHPLKIHALPETISALKKHIFNDEIWPDFSKLPTEKKGQFVFIEIKSGEEIEVEGLKITPIKAAHTVPTVGYKIDDNTSSVIFSGDTAPIRSLWNVANKTENLKAIILDLSFPIEEQKIATISKHMTASDVEKELKRLKVDCDVYAFHYKVGSALMLEAQSNHINHFGRPIKPLREVDEIIV